jgi:uncharacterized protein (TIGR02147 family)
MVKVSIYKYIDYKAYLREVFLKSENRGLMTEAAEVLVCAKSYLSRVLREKMDLSLDQAYRLGNFFSLQKNELEYFCLLVDLGRAQSSEYKTHLRHKIQELKLQHEESQTRGAHPVQTLSDTDIEYYSYWLLIPLHLSTSSKNGISLSEAREKFCLPESSLKMAFQYLLDRKWIRETKGRYYFETGSQYLPHNHPLLTMLHRSLREQAMANSYHKNPTDIHYSLWQTMSQDDYLKIRDLLLSAVDKANKIAQPSNSERVVGFNIDFFAPFEKK